MRVRVRIRTVAAPHLANKLLRVRAPRGASGPPPERRAKGGMQPTKQRPPDERLVRGSGLGLGPGLGLGLGLGWARVRVKVRIGMSA